MSDTRKQTGDLVLEQTDRRTQEPTLYKVLLLNDDYTTMEFVVHVLESIFDKSPAEAYRVMMQVHTATAAGLCRRLHLGGRRDQGRRGARAGGRSRAYPLRAAIEEGGPDVQRVSKWCSTWPIREAVSRRHAHLTLEHLLYALAHDPDGEEILAALRRRPRRLRARARRLPRADAIEQLPRGPGAEPEQTLAFRRVLQTAVLHVQSAGKSEAEVGDVLAAILQEPRSHAATLLEGAGRHAGSTCSNYISHGIAQGRPRRAGGRRRGRRPAGEGEEDARHAAAIRSTAYAVNLTDRARQRQARPADRPRRRRSSATLEVLCRRRKNNPVFVGDAGVGKTALVEGLAQRLARRRRARRSCKGAEIFALDTGRAARRHPLPRRLRGALQGRASPRWRSGAQADPVHRRDPHDGRRRRHHRRHDGPRQPAQAGADRPASCADRLDDLRGVQALRAGPRAGAAAPEDRRRRAVGRGDACRSSRGCGRRYEEHHGVQLHRRGARGRRASWRARHLRDHRLPDKAIDVHRRGRRAAACAAWHAPTRRRSRATVDVAEIERVVARMARIPETQAVVVRQGAAAHARGVAQARRLRPGRGGRAGRAADQARRAPASASRTSPAGCFLFTGPDRRRQDRARQAARRAPGHRVPPLRHERVHGEARGLAADRRALRATSASTRAACWSTRCASTPTACCCSTRSRRPTRTSSTSCCR